MFVNEVCQRKTFLEGISGFFILTLRGKMKPTKDQVFFSVK